MEQTRHSDEILATAPIGKLILKLAVPSVAAQIINMLYNIVDISRRSGTWPSPAWESRSRSSP